jgi:hypothetical protein
MENLEIRVHLDRLDFLGNLASLAVLVLLESQDNTELKLVTNLFLLFKILEFYRTSRPLRTAW